MKNGFSKSDIQRRIDEVRVSVMEQMKKNMDNYVWTHIKSLDELEEVRMSAMRMFLSDYESGKKENRYICHELPEKLPYSDKVVKLAIQEAKKEKICMRLRKQI